MFLNSCSNEQLVVVAFIPRFFNRQLFWAGKLLCGFFELIEIFLADKKLELRAEIGILFFLYIVFEKSSYL